MEIVRRSFLRACINHGTLQMDVANNILDELCTANNVNKPEMESFINEIDNSIKQYGQTLQRQKFSLTRKEFVVFAVTAETGPQKKIHPTLSENERLYFTGLLDKICQTENYEIDWHEAYSITPANLGHTQNKTLPKKRMQELLEQWKSQGFFFDQNDSVFFGPRMLLEFDFYFRKNYADFVKDCPLCKKLVFWDIKCGSCDIKIHFDCIRTFLRKRTKCPACQELWSTPIN